MDFTSRRAGMVAWRRLTHPHKTDKEGWLVLWIFWGHLYRDFT